MAQMIIRLIRDPGTGKQNIIVKLESDADALPHEHEELHRRLVEQLVGKGRPIEDLGELIIEREPTAPTKSRSDPRPEPTGERQANPTS
jgi:hypothetical protein